MVKTYGNTTVPDRPVSITTTASTTWGQNTTEIFGHDLSLNNDGSIVCETCSFEGEVPGLLQTSSGFRQVVYRLYILGKADRQPCEGPRPNSMYAEETDAHITKGRVIQVSGHELIYDGQGIWRTEHGYLRTEDLVDAGGIRDLKKVMKLPPTDSSSIYNCTHKYSNNSDGSDEADESDGLLSRLSNAIF